ncbi:DNA polymerase I [Wenzhouxiangella sp. XN79A]|uniref:DNA polymerase I n=1 Tax=Wenzhouxiangella sp. XN79A TaxID=2724193 RepID=UPI00144A6CDD|nr:DNA polymerase I [Wenzhouxiangella sp. XN79A]NKI35246.1 DNA polymerase I [Wenzhouxiangella sp. XN79A]
MASNEHETLYLVDGSSYLYRAFHALPSLTAADGQPTGAIFGVANMVRRLIHERAPARLAVIFDAPGRNFRHDLDPEYKANRPPMPGDLRRQIEPLHEVIDAMGVQRVIVDGVEADDVIATLVRRAREAGAPVLISSGDKDLAQLVGDDVVLEDTMQDKRYDPAAVEEKFGVGPDLVGDLLALTGDASDNIPGVEKCGPKTAAKWLNKYGSLAAVIEHADEIGGRIGEHLNAALDQLPRSRELVALKDDVALDFDLDALGPPEADRERLVELLKRFGFTTWLRQVDAGDADDGPAGDAAADLDIELVTTRGQLAALVEALERAELIAFDTETTSLEPLDADLVGFSFAVEPGRAYYVPVGHVDQDTEFDRDEAVAALRPVLEDADRPKLAHHTKYDLNVLERAGVRLAGIAHDTMLESYCYNATATRHDLDSLAGRYLGRTTISYEDVAGKGKAQLRFDEVPVAAAADYAGEDAEVCLALHRKLWPELAESGRAAEVYRDLEIPLIRVLARMERTGVLVDTERLAVQSAELAERMSELEQQAWAAAGGEFNLGSPKQLQEILFERLEIPVVRKTPKGQPSTAEDVLQELAAEHALPALILKHRSLSKLKSTYTDRLPEKVRADSGRIHTHYHQANTATGRLSSADPNLQNIPIRTEEGRRIRKAFVAPDGWRVMAADYSQIELRIMAHLSDDDGLKKAFAAGEDIHRATAAEVFGRTLDEVTADQRRAAKAINFGLMYGMSAWGLARQLETDRDTASEYIDTYFARYPGVRDFMDRTREQARRDGFVETLAGRRLWLPEIRSRNRQRQQAAERAAINAPLQGTAADIIKRAMLDVDAWLTGDEAPARLIMQVHDELVLEVREEAVQEVGKGITERMEAAAELDVELIVEVGIGEDWDAAH